MYWYYRASALAGVRARVATARYLRRRGHIQTRIGVEGARNQRLTRPNRDMHGFIDASLKPDPANNLSFLCDKCPLAAEVRQAPSLFQKYGSIGVSPYPYAVDIVSMALETRHGVWMAEVPIKPKGISKKKQTIGQPEFRHFTEVEGRFVNLLPMKDGAATLH